ncbi:condensation domain-containing protein, partial [Burkholderia gladioli]
HLLATDGDPFVLSAMFAVESRERLDGFVDALRQVIARHDILRTSVHWEGLPEPVQVVWRDAPLRVDEVVLDESGGDRAKQLRARFDARHLRLEVREAPLLRVIVAREQGERWLMFVLFHHLAMDHTALEVVRQEVEAHLLGAAAQLPPSVPFRNYVAQARLGVSRDEHLAFFREMLADVDEPTLPFGLREVRGDGHGINEATLEVDKALARRVRTLARQHGVSAASLFHLAWARLVGHASGRDDVVFGTVMFGRLQAGAELGRALGMFINTLPIRVKLAHGVKDELGRTHRLLTQLLRHEHASLALTQQCSGIVAPAPLFSSLLNYRYTDPVAAEAAQNAWGGIDSREGEERTNYPLVMSVDDLGEDFRLTGQVLDIFRAETI